MTISCLKFDSQKIIDGIQEYRIKNEDDPVLFMSIETITELAKSYEICVSNSLGTTCLFNGCYVYLNNNLDYGEVDIR